MADEHISYGVMVNREVGPMEHTTHYRDFVLCSDRMAPVESGVGGKLKRLARRLSGALVHQCQGEVDQEIARVLARSGGRITDSMEREMMQKALTSDWSLPQ
jgi:hypothetical protein